METMTLTFLITFLLSAVGALTPMDRFSIYEQMALHQSYIDIDLTCDNSRLYASLYWPEASFRVIDPNRDLTVTGHREIRSNFDSAHSVFPLYMWRHSLGAFEIQPAESGSDGYVRANAYWKWRVDWKANTTVRILSEGQNRRPETVANPSSSA